MQKNDHVRTRGEDGPLQTKQRDLQKKQHLPDSRSSDFQPREPRETQSLLFEPPSLWYLAMAALANQHIRDLI